MKQSKNTEILEKIIKSRRSIRKFKDTAIPDEDVRQVVEAAGFAPSNTNYQPWKFIYVKDRKVKEKLKDIVVNKIKVVEKTFIDQEAKDEFIRYSKYFTFFSDAPGLIVAIYKKTPPVLQNFIKDENIKNDIDNISAELSSVSAAIQNMLLMLHSMGYGACWNTGPLIACKEIKDFLEIMPPFEIAALIPFGVSDEKPNMPKRKELEKIFTIK